MYRLMVQDLLERQKITSILGHRLLLRLPACPGQVSGDTFARSRGAGRPWRQLGRNVK